jgi:hypothetical protein
MPMESSQKLFGNPLSRQQAKAVLLPNENGLDGLLLGLPDGVREGLGRGPVAEFIDPVRE